ncbi:MAG: hypothetical protein IKE22_10765, partial [Atopobiaceae bacterium]|nr:hypothetical protein [Atopobiaceae bacterium]
MALNDTNLHKQPQENHRIRMALRVIVIAALIASVGFGVFYFLARTLSPSTSVVQPIRTSELTKLDPVLIDVQDV